MSRQEQIINAALKLFVQYGFHATPTSKIAKEAGVANGTLFHYFQNKEQLVSEIYLQLKLELITFLSEDIETKKTTRQKIEHMWYKWIKWSFSNKDKYVFLSMYYNSPYIDPMSKKEAGESFQFFLNILNDGVKEGTLIDISINLLNGFIYGSVNTIFDHYSKTSEVVSEDELEKYFKMLWRGISNV